MSAAKKRNPIKYAASAYVLIVGVLGFLALIDMWGGDTEFLLTLFSAGRRASLIGWRTAWRFVCVAAEAVLVVALLLENKPLGFFALAFLCGFRAVFEVVLLSKSRFALSREAITCLFLLAAAAFVILASITKKRTVVYLSASVATSVVYLILSSSYAAVSKGHHYSVSVLTFPELLPKALLLAAFFLLIGLSMSGIRAKEPVARIKQPKPRVRLSLWPTMVHLSRLLPVWKVLSTSAKCLGASTCVLLRTS